MEYSELNKFEFPPESKTEATYFTVKSKLTNDIYACKKYSFYQNQAL